MVRCSVYLRPPTTAHLETSFRAGGRSVSAAQPQIPLITPTSGAIMLHSTVALSFLLIAVTSNLAMAINKEKRPPQTLSRGWGDDITWVQTYEEGLFKSKQNNKPLMIIHHLPECQFCQALKTAFAEHEEAQELAQINFIMLNIMHETTDKNLSPDGQYVPRIMFVDPTLTVRADITGRYSNRLYTYEPQDMPLLVENMQKAIRLVQTEL